MTPTLGTALLAVVALLATFAGFALAIDLLFHGISRRVKGGRSPLAMLSLFALAASVVLVHGAAYALPILATYSGFAGNGRGGPVASQPTCNDQTRGRTWDLYGTPNNGTITDIFKACMYTSGGTYSWKVVTTT